MHDRHWKIHWMLNFAQLSATLNLRAVMEKTHGKVDEVLLGRLQNSADDRNWDKIRALWEMKEEVKADTELAPLFEGDDRARDRARPRRPRERGRRFIADRVVPYQKEFGWHAVWSHEFIFPSFREDMNPVIQLVRDQYASDYDYPSKVAALKADIDAAAGEILEGLEGEALEEMRAANEINLKMAPLTPDHHFYIDQGANAHVRLVLIAIGEKLVEMGVLDAPDDVILFRYNELREFIGDAGQHGRSGHRRRGQGQAGSGRAVPAQGLGRHGDRDAAGLPVPQPVGLPGQVQPIPREGGAARSSASPARRASSRASRASSSSETSSTAFVPGEILVCQMTNPAWQVLYGKIIAVVTDAGGTVSHPAVLAREYGIPAVVGTSVGTSPHQDRRSHPRRRQRRRGRDPRARRAIGHAS